MALNKQQVNVNFQKGLDTKTDPWQLPIGSFLNLENSVFNKFGLLEKRKGFDQLKNVSGLNIKSLSVFKNELIALGNRLYSYREQDGSLLDRGVYKPAKVSVQSVVKNTFNQIQADAAVASNDSCCIAYSEGVTGTVCKYSVVNYRTGQVIVSPTLVTSTGAGTVNSAPRVYVTGSNYVVVYGSLVGGTQTLQCLLINKNTFTTTGPIQISNDFYKGKASFDAVFANGLLYVIWGRASAGGVYATTIDENGAVATTVSITGSFQADVVAATYDTSTTALIFGYFSWATYVGRVTSRDLGLNQIYAPTDFITTTATTKLLNLSLSSLSGTCQIIWDRENYYSYDTASPTSYIQKRTVTAAGVLGTSPGTTALVRSLGLGAKSFILDGIIYIVAAYQSAQQSGFYVLDLDGNVLAKYAYQNGGGYPAYAIPNSTVINSTVSIPYLIQFFIREINKDNNDPVPGVYSQLGINLATVDMGDVPVYSAELGNNLNMSGGFLWSYDGSLPNENNFFVYPENIKVQGQSSTGVVTAAYTNGSTTVTVSSTANIQPGYYLFTPDNFPVNIFKVEAILSPTTVRVTGPITASYAATNTFIYGSITPGDYSYSVIYEWTDNQGNIIRSAPSIPTLYTVPNVSPIGTTTFFGNLTSGQNTITTVTEAEAELLRVGQIIRQLNIPANTTITDIKKQDNGFYTITMSNNATLTGAFTISILPVTSVVLNIPTLRISYKSNVMIRVYRYSAAQPVAHLVGSVDNNKTVDSVTFLDTFSDENIVNNTILYTNSGVENLPGPPSGPMTIWDNRLWVLDTEKPNSVWYSKTVIDGVSCEMSDLFTFYINPTNSAQGSTSPVTSLSVMDDKLIVFKKDAIYYINGSGPDNLGNNSQFSEPILITSTVGTSLPNSICVIPEGLLFQSDKGIWLVGRNGQTLYLGAPVEAFTQTAVCLASSIVPETNQARFVMDDSNILVYDYFFQQWGRFTNIAGVDSVIYKTKQTILDEYERILIQSDTSYSDVGDPVVMKFTTNWFAIAGILGFQRAYFLFFLAKYLSPHKLTINIAYDFNPSTSQQIVITPDNFSQVFGGSPYYGTGVFGGPSQVERWRLMLSRQKCDSVRIEFIEQYDPSYGVAPGAGFTMSGLNFIIGVKREFNTLPASLTAG